MIGRGVVLLVAAGLTTGCVSRAAMQRMQDQLDYLEASHQRMERDLLRVDSLTVLSADESRRTRAEVGTTLEEFRSEVSALRETVEDVRQTLERRPVLAPYQPAGGTIPAMGEPGTTERPAVPADADPAKMYEDAFLDVRKGNYELAIDQFREILSYFGETEYAPSALYWIGECWYSLAGGATESGEDKAAYYDSAVTDFQKLIEGFPQSDRVPTALYKLGRCYEELGRPRQARTYYQRVVDDYPRSLEAKPARGRLDELK